MAKTTVKPRAFAFIVSDIQHALGNPALLLAHVRYQAKRHSGIPPDCVRLAEKLALVAFRLFPRPFDFMPLSVGEQWGWNQRVSLQKCANLVIVWTDWRMRDRLVSSQSIRVVIGFVIDAWRWNLSEIEAVFSC